MPPRRRRRKFVLAGLALALCLGVYGAVSWLPERIRARAEHDLRVRTGLKVRVPRASLRLWGVDLEDVVLSEGRGLSARIPEIELRVPVLHWSRIRVRIRDPVFHVDLSKPRVAETLERLARRQVRRVSNTNSASDSRSYSVTIVGARGDVRDAHGKLMQLSHGALSWSRGKALVAEAQRCVIGSSPGDVLDLRAFKAVLQDGASGRALDLVAVGEGTAVLADQSEGEEGPPRIQERLRAALSMLRGPQAPAEPLAEAPGHVPFHILGQSFSADLRNVRVRSRTEEGGKDIVRGLHLTLRRVGEESFELRGGGSPAAGGKLEANLRLWPADLRAEGRVAFERVPLALVVPFLPEIPWHEPDEALLDGALDLTAGEAGELALKGHVGVVDAALSSPRVAAHPVRGIAATVEGNGSWFYGERRLAIDEARLRMGDAELEMTGSLAFDGDQYAIDLTATLPRVGCNAAVSAIPRDLLGDVGGFSFSGRMAGQVVAKIDSTNLEDTVFEIDVSDACTFEMVPPLASVERFREPFLHSVFEPDGTSFEMMSGPGSETWVPIGSMSPFFVHAVLAHEDASFFAHHGFAPWSIRDALVRNLMEKRFVVGASTIVMQLVKNLFLRREKTLARKVQEVILTWWIDHALTKRDTLELYLNIIEYGPGIYGARQAAQHYFGRTVAELSPAEGALLATILPNPKRYYGNYVRGTLSPGTATSMRQLLEHMHARGRIDAVALAYALQEIEKFAFPPQGVTPEPRVVAGTATPLPLGASASDDWESTVDAQGEFDSSEEEAGW